ncbi:MAG: hypothetical protein WD894_05555 [Pirellulales bacterium]
MLLIAVGWTATEFQPAGQPDPVAATPDWRRTSEGWVKVGAAGAAGLEAASPAPARDPALHPGAVAAFLLLVGSLCLALFERPVVALHKTESVSRSEHPV